MLSIVRMSGPPTRSQIGDGRCFLSLGIRTAPFGNVPHFAVPAVDSDTLQGVQVRRDGAPVDQWYFVVVLNVNVV